MSGRWEGDIVATRIRVPDPGGPPGFGLPAAPATRYRDRRARLDPAARARLDRAATNRYLRRAFAAGHDLATVEWLAAEWSARGDAWTNRTIGRFDAGPGPVPHHDQTFAQCDGRTCGPTAVVAARMIADPAFAHAVSTGPPAALAAAQRTAHRAANLLWPRALGVTPPGIAAILNVHSGAFGARYGWRAVGKATRQALSTAATAANHGWPVPLLLAGRIPRHWVLVTRGTDDALRCFEPTAGHLVDVDIDEIVDGRRTALGPPNPRAVVLPTYPYRDPEGAG